MDKYEYKLKLDQMKSLATENDYQTAAQIADSINWRKIKNVNALVKAGEIYEKVGRYEDSREILLMAYDRSPIGRMIIYRLAEVAIKMKNFDEAKDYYNEFVEIAPHDNLKYVLKYEISKAQGADDKTLIAILEELKEKEYSEEWAYELAYLYHKAGMSEKCIEACDELILWFGDGVYVERALELKMLYQPLSRQQEEKYRQFRQRREGIVEVRPEDALESGEIVSEPVKIPGVAMSPERFNTQNLQEELQKSMRQIMEATEKETVSDSMDTIKKLVEDIPYLQIPIEKNEELHEAEEEAHIETDAEIDDSLKMNFQELLEEEYDGQMSLFVPESGEREQQIMGQMSIEDVLAEWEKTKRAAEAALYEAEQRKLESAKARALQEAGDIMERLADVIPKLDSGLTPKELLEEQYLGGQPLEDEKAAEMVANMNQILQQEIDRLNDENAQMDEQLAAVGAAGISTFNITDGMTELVSEDEAGDDLLSDDEEEALAEDADQIAEDTIKDIGMLAAEELQVEEFLPEDMEAETAGNEAVEELQTEETEIGSEVAEELQTEEADVKAEASEEPQTEEADEEIDVEEAILAETAKQMAQEAAEEQPLPKIDISEDVPKSKEEIPLPKIAEPETLDATEAITKLSKEQRSTFTYFVPIKGMEQQLCQAMTGAAAHLKKGTSAGTGNMIIQGGHGSGKTVLATSMVKALQKETGKLNGKVGKIAASTLNQKDVAELLRKVAGGCLIIEQAGDLSRETAVKLSLLLENDHSGVMVIIEDTKHGIEKALARDDGFASRFSEKINIPIFTSDELVTFAKSYANELGYTIDEMGVLALYNCISNIQKVDRATTLTEVKEIVDNAVHRAEKGGLKKAFGILTSRRYDEEDYIILREKDFDLRV